MGPNGRNSDGVDADCADQHDLDSYKQAERSLSLLQAPVFLHANNPHERLYFAALDGTGNSIFKDAPENWSAVAKTYAQVRALEDKGAANIKSGYVEGTFTQSNVADRYRDGFTGYTFERRVETAYKQFIEQAKKWVDEDPHAKIRVAGMGFSRGTEEVAALTRLIEERGIQNPTGAQYTFDNNKLVTSVQYTKPPLVQPGHIMQAAMLFDPVSTGLKEHDRRLAPSVMTAFQITAEDERRDQFKSTDQLQPGFSEGRRFLNVTVGGAHSDIGDTYVQNGLGVRSSNLGVDFLNSLSDTPYLRKRAVPPGLALSVVHHSEQHLGGLYPTFSTIDGVRNHENELAPAEDYHGEHIRDRWHKEPINLEMDRQLDRRGVPIGQEPVAPLPALRPSSPAEVQHDLAVGRGPTNDNPELSHLHDPRNQTYSDPNLQPSPQAQASKLDHLPPHHPDYALFASIREKLPAGTSEEMAVHVALEARIGGIKAGEIERFEVHDGKACVLGRIPGDRAIVDLNEPAPSIQETLQRSQSFDQHQTVQLAQQMEQQRQAEGRHRSPGGPGLT